MKRAIFVALCTGAVITSGAALSTGPAAEPGRRYDGSDEVTVARARQDAREAQRARIQARYRQDRAHCETLGGFQRDRCLVKAHARKGRAMLHAAAPYEVRF